MKDFLFGIIFITIIPLLGDILSVVKQYLLHICTVIEAKTYQIEKTIRDEEQKESGESSFAVGFHMSEAKSLLDNEENNDEDY